MISSTRLRSRRLVFELSSRQGLAIELISYHCTNLGGHKRRVTLPILCDKKLHSVCGGQNKRSGLTVDARHCRCLKGTRRARVSRFGIPKETIRVGAHAQDVGRFVNGDINIVLNDRRRGSAIAAEFNLVEAKILEDKQQARLVS